MRAVGWGIVGFGWVARDHAVPGIVASGGVVVGVVDPSREARRAACASGVVAHEDMDDLMADPAVEAVYVATPNDTHARVVELAAAAGKAVLCEKPMASTLDGAKVIASAVRANGILYGTAFDQRHHPAHSTMQAAIGRGSVGVVTAVRIVYACWLDRDWAARNWRIDAGRAGGGALIDLAPHGLDLVEFLLGEPVVDIAAFIQKRVHDYDVDDGAMLIGSTRSGVLVSLHVAYNHPETLKRRRLEIVGTRGMLVAEDTMGQDAGGSVVLHDASDGRTTSLAVGGMSPFEAQMRAFGAAMRGDGAAMFDVERDLHTMALLDRAYRSARCH